MEPFIGHSFNQNNDYNKNKNEMSIFTGTEPLYDHKSEVTNFFSNRKQIVNGQQLPNNWSYDRYNTKLEKTNIIPFEQIKVGPGIGEKIGENRPGFHPNYNPTYKNVDDLRINPKITYKGRLISGQKYIKSEMKPNVEKNRPNTTFKWGIERQNQTTFAGIGKHKVYENFGNAL